MHQTQGFANFTGFGGRGNRPETFVLLAGIAATNDILDDVDTTWSRVPGGQEIGELADDVMAKFDSMLRRPAFPACWHCEAGWPGSKRQPH